MQTDTPMAQGPRELWLAAAVVALMVATGAFMWGARGASTSGGPAYVAELASIARGPPVPLYPMAAEETAPSGPVCLRAPSEPRGARVFD